ncbi:phosphoglycerate mutase [Corticibacter populi]|uniref:Phosphoglycerate mutase n=2 Tax=Corticibacter populi TaxID=1550736 RepID=A0A3M6QKP9_9BURK|nr:phosphoglycerate mutase [Corticibacter populi]
MPIHILPFAAIDGLQEYGTTTGHRPALPQLNRLLARLPQRHWLRIGADTPTAPHEFALSHLLETLGGPAREFSAEHPPLSLAALQAHALKLAGSAGQPAGWAFVTPSHLQITTDRIQLTDPAQLQLSPAHSQALLASVQALWEEDGITLHAIAPDRWLAGADWLDGLPTTSLDRAIHRDVRQWMPALGQTGRLQRLQTEIQMLLYHHPVNDARAATGLPAINALWCSGTGRNDHLDALTPGLARLHVEESLRQPALAGHIQAWLNQWQTLDADWLPQLEAALARGEDLQLVLCGERHAVILAAATSPASRWHQLGTRLRQWRPWATARRTDPVTDLLLEL